MIALPIPLIFSGLILVFLARSLQERKGLRAFHLLLLVCGVQSALVALVHHYGVTVLRPVLPVTACLIPVLAWIAHRITQAKGAELWHLALPALVAGLIFVQPEAVDLALPLIFAGYGTAILLSLRASPDLPNARLSSGPVPGQLWLAMGLSLIISALSDLAIVGMVIAGRADVIPLVISSVSAAALLAIAVLAVLQDDPDPTEAPEPADGPSPTPEATAEDSALFARTEALVTEEQLYLDPDLTLARLARRLHVPIKQLSAAINRQTGHNVSRYVNGHRIAHAGRLLKAGHPVTEVIYAAGFNTKSNFNREFQRVMGAAPRDWLAKT